MIQWSCNQTKQRVSLLPEAAGELLGIDNFETKLDPTIPRPDPDKRGFGFTDGEGKEFRMEN